MAFSKCIDVFDYDDLNYLSYGCNDMFYSEI